jgi:hypothetical protein
MEEMEELTCREVVEVATDHLERALPAAAVDRLVRHLTGLARYQDHGIPDGDQAGRHGNAQAPLAGCAGCRAYLGQLRLAIRLLSLIGGRGPSSGRR